MTQEKLNKIEMMEKFNHLSGELRVAKINSKKASKIERDLKKELTDLAFELQLDKGDYNGIKLMHRYKFILSDANKKVIEDNEIEIPVDTSLDLTPRRIKQLIDKGVIKEKEIKKTPNIKELEKILKEENLIDECEYELSYAFGFATE